MGVTAQQALAKALDTLEEYKDKYCRGGLKVWVDYAAEMPQTWPTLGVEKQQLSGKFARFWYWELYEATKPQSLSAVESLPSLKQYAVLW